MYTKKWFFIPLVIIIALFVAFFLRWETVEIRKDGFLTKYKTDRWTGQKWIQVFGNGLAGEEKFYIDEQTLKETQWQHEKKMGLLPLLKKRDSAKSKLKDIVASWNKQQTSQSSLYDNQRIELGLFSIAPGRWQDPEYQKTYDEIRDINRQIDSTTKKAKEQAIYELTSKAEDDRKFATYWWISLVGASSIAVAFAYRKWLIKRYENKGC